MSVAILFSIIVGFIFLISSLLLMTTTAADLRKAATARRLKSLRSAPAAQTIEVVGSDGPRRRPTELPNFVPMRLRTRIMKSYAAASHAMDTRLLPLFALAGCAIGGFLSAAMLHLSLSLVILSSIALGLLTPYQAMRMAKARLSAKFLRLFPDAIDLIVRAIRAGLPVSASIEMAGKEVSDPVGAEFRLLMADIRVGNTFPEALSRAAERMQLVEFSFFTASLTLQNETGGNLSETLETLGNVLRRREEMRLKISAMTSEAKTSAYVMGALPICVGTLLCFVAPDYMAVYWNDPRGSYVLGMAAISMAVGALVMRFMIKKVTG